MARATTRSQKASAPSQSQRQRRSINNESDDEEDESDQGRAGAGMEVDEEVNREQGDAGMELKRKASELVRLALFTEHKRTPLRREDISKKVLGSNTRAFNHVFETAQELLRSTFGMELVELQTRAGLEQDANLNATQDDLNEARKATGIKKKAVAAGSKTYILRSILDPLIIEHAALTDEHLLEIEATDAPDEDEVDSDDDGSGSRYYGSVISWSKADQLGSLGIQYVILALIMVNGRVISDMDFRAHLKKLGLPLTSTLTFNAQSTHKNMSVDQYLSMLIRQGYLDRQQTGEAGKKAGKAKRGRISTNADDDSGVTYEWRWGPRAQSEVGEKGIAQFVAEFMVGDAGDEEEEEEEAGRRGRGRGGAGKESAQDKLEKMLKGIERAAGGQLADLK